VMEAAMAAVEFMMSLSCRREAREAAERREPERLPSPAAERLTTARQTIAAGLVGLIGLVGTGAARYEIGARADRGGLPTAASVAEAPLLIAACCGTGDVLGCCCCCAPSCRSALVLATSR